MNREERRDLKKQGARQETIDKMDALQSPATLAEVVQISRATAEDVLIDYVNNNKPLQVSLALQLEIIKETLISSGMIREDFFQRLYQQKIEEFNRMQKERYAEDPKKPTADSPKMDVTVNDIDVKVEE